MTEIDTGYLKRIAEATETESASVGDASAANQASQITQETATAAALGATTGAAVITDANGTIQQYLRGLVKLWIAGFSRPVGVTPTDRTIVAASGASQTLMAANINRKSLTIVNTGNADWGVNPTGGTAIIGGAGTLTLVPMGAYSPRVPTLSAVTVIGTAGQPIYADES